MTGGRNYANVGSAEAFHGGFAEKDLMNSFRCLLPSLPNSRSGHTQSGLEVCGGHDSVTMTNCLTFSNGTWTTSHNLLHPRTNHTSWLSPKGVVLMGGSFSPNTSELLSNYYFQVRGAIRNGTKNIFKGLCHLTPHAFPF